MSQEKLFEAAKEGNPQAIAAMINRSLEPKGITVKASSHNRCLIIVAESQTAPKQEAVFNFLKDGIAKLEPANTSRVIVRGRAAGQTITTWQESFSLGSSEVSVSRSHTSTVHSASTASNPNKSKVLISSSSIGSNILDYLLTYKPINGAKAQSSKTAAQTLGQLLFIIGSGMMLIGLAYDPTEVSGAFGIERTYNIGKINIKSTYTNTGGFLAVCGAIFTTCSRSNEGDKGEDK